MVVSVLAPNRSAAQSGLPRVSDGAVQVLQPGDRVRLTVHREPELSGEFGVDENGMIVVPKIGRIEVRDLAPDSLKSLLIAGYAGSLRDPAVEITLLRRVNVVGAVRSPGLYYVDPTVTVSGVVALAGGVTTDGSRERIELIRAGTSRRISVAGEAPGTGSFLRSGDELVVRERSWLSRNTGFVSAGLTAMAVVFAALIR
jgi:protein involved in polysaccharide export with SLBB domain